MACPVTHKITFKFERSFDISELDLYMASLIQTGIYSLEEAAAIKVQILRAANGAEEVFLHTDVKYKSNPAPGDSHVPRLLVKNPAPERPAAPRPQQFRDIPEPGIHRPVPMFPAPRGITKQRNPPAAPKKTRPIPHRPRPQVPPLRLDGMP